MVRPKKVKKEKLDKDIKFNVTQTEFNEITEEGKSIGFGSVHKYSGHIVRHRKKKFLLLEDIEKLLNFYKDIRNLISNINYAYIKEYDYLPVELQLCNEKLQEILEFLESLFV